MPAYLVQPPRGERLSGGFLYNQGLASASPELRLSELAPDDLAPGLARLGASERDWLLADSLFLNKALFEPFVAVRRRTGCRLGVVLHALPSFIQRASVSHPHGLAGLAPTPEELELVGALDAVVCPGPFMQRLLAASAPSVLSLLCPPGSTAALAAPPPPPPPSATPLKLLSVGNVTRLKGYQDGLLALASAKHLAWQWDIVGDLEQDPGCTAELEGLTAQLGLSGRVRFLGRLSHAETLALYPNAQIFVLSSYTENYPLVLLEAQAHALPIVAYDIGGVPDIVSHAEDGLLAPAFEREVLAGYATRLMEAPELRRRYASAALDAARARWGWAEAARNFEQLLELDGPTAP